MGPTLMETKEVAPLLGLPWWDKQVPDRSDSDMMGIYKTGGEAGGAGGAAHQLCGRGWCFQAPT